MRLVSYRTGNGVRAGVVVGGSMATGGVVVDAQLAATRLNRHDRDVPAPTLKGLLAAGFVRHELLEAATQLATAGRVVGHPEIAPPVPDADKILCIGVNYREHAAEAGLDAPAVPMLFAKYSNSLIGQGEPIVVPRVTSEVDYEGELAVVIGRTCKDVGREQALDYVAGGMPFNDVTARDLQNRVSQWTTGKAVDTFAPCGPELVTLDETGPLDQLVLTTHVNDVEVQHASTSLLIHDVPSLVAFLSQTITLQPGDIIATGTPAGVGFKRNPPLFLRDGDEVSVEISGLGRLSNPIVAAHDRVSLTAS